jgi:hypothetical protein
MTSASKSRTADVIYDPKKAFSPPTNLLWSYNDHDEVEEVVVEVEEEEEDERRQQ